MPDHHAASTEFVRVGDEGNACQFHFCPRCGATVYCWFYADFRAVPVGAFADPTFEAPGACLHEERRHTRLSVPEGARHLF